jgi:uncharacterized protein YuzE
MEKSKQVMTNEEIIEEILIEAHEYGMRIEVLETARKILDNNPNMDKVIAYEEAFNEWVK